MRGSKQKKMRRKIEEIIIDLYNSTTPLKTLEKQLGIDQRKIRKIWRNYFGTSKRKISTSKKISCIDKIFSMIGNGSSVDDIAIYLNISKSVIFKYVRTSSKLKDMMKIRTRNKRVESMKQLRQKDAIPVNIKNLVAKQFITDKSLAVIGNTYNISMGSVKKIFLEYFGEQKYKNRVERMRVIRFKNIFHSLEIAGKFGSKPEKKFFDLLRNNLEYDVIHHDLNLLPPYEIDITIPDLKIAINWNGITHHKPIFGKKYLNKTKFRDRYKKSALIKKDWYVFTIDDLESRYSDDFINFQFNRLMFVIKNRSFFKCKAL